MIRVTPVTLLAALLVTASVWAGMGKEAHPLKAMVGSKAEAHLNESIEHYGKGHWDVAKKHFAAGEQADPQSAEAHTTLRWFLIRPATTPAQRRIFRRPMTLANQCRDPRLGDFEEAS